jgi:hypothetical protein
MMLVAADEDGYKSLSSAQQVFAASGLASLEGNRDDGISFAHNAAKVTTRLASWVSTEKARGSMPM